MAIKRNEEILTPVFVTGMGRSGSTLAMQLLGTDPTCVFDQVYPLESRYLSLITHYTAQWKGWTFADYGQTASAYQSILGTNPVVLRNKAEANQLISVPNAEEIFQALWKQFSASVRKTSPQATFYAEKVVEWMPSFLAPMLDVYALYLFRDPRDLFLSANSFNSKRGYLAFGRGEADSDRDHALTLAYRFLHRFECYKAFKAAGGNVSLIRYEDLALNPIPSLSDLVEKTGMQIKPLEDKNSYSQHRTSKSIEQSINRWKREPISKEVLDIFDEVLSPVLIEMGYETSNPAPAEFNLNFCDANAGGLKTRIARLNHAEVEGVSERGLSLKSTMPKASGTEPRSIEIDFDMNGLDSNRVSEIWLCLAGSFGGSCKLGWVSGSSQFTANDSSEFHKQYDSGPHCTTLRFSLKHEAEWRDTLSQLRLIVSQTSAQADASELQIRSIKLVSKGEAAVAQPDEDERSRKPKGFFNQLLGKS